MNFHSDKIDWDQVNLELENIDWQHKLSDLPPEQMLAVIIDATYNVTKNHVPQKSVNKNKHIIPRDRRILMRRRARINKRIQNMKSPSRKEKLLHELISIEKQLQKSRKSSKTYEERKAVESIKKNSKYFFTYAKKYSKLHHNIGPLKNEKGEYIYDNKLIAEMFSKQYSSVFSEPTKNNYTAEEIFPHNHESQLSDLDLTDNMFLEAIKELSPSSASGPDGIPSILLINCKEIYAKILCILWKKCLNMEVTPLNLRQPDVIPIYKAAEKTEPSNYRPISLTSHFIKVFEKVVRNSIVNHLESNSYFNDNQHGFRKGRSCLSELLAHYEEVSEYLQNNEGVDTVYLDFAKAFDKVDFYILLNKLKCLGIGGRLGRWIYSFLHDRYQTVLVNGTKSDPAEVKSGVPQGSVLGPILFIIMIYDIDVSVLHSSVKSFADDTRVTNPVTDVHSATNLQRDLNVIYDWADENSMQFNSLGAHTLPPRFFLETGSGATQAKV